MERRDTLSAFASAVVLCVAASAPSGCVSHRAELKSAERAFSQDQHELTLALLRDLEEDLRHMTPQERAVYSYLRGMTDYRVGYRVDARTWLGMAWAEHQRDASLLSEDWAKRSREVLAEMNEEVIERGVESLTNDARRGGGEKPLGEGRPAPTQKNPAPTSPHSDTSTTAPETP
jgi:hypothetical protein